ncbi:MAG: rhodanese-like domain-containing protein [Proteobacteria bacterium]|nr:rhodanese-like domain-containing protein [Pseudomonadota bacterium]MBU1594493.1 rhodanese-like domain-containing protein [Pseudomonadota bacterium]
MRLVLRILGQGLGILALSVALALVVNAVRPDGLPLLRTSPLTAPRAAPDMAQPGQDAGEIALKDAALLFLSGRAAFLDARSQFEFELGHIQGAISLPVRNFASEFQDVKPRLAGKDAVIAYCDGEQCPLSHALARHLREAGVKNVYVLKNGWSLWQAERLPVSGVRAAQAAPAPQAGPAPKMRQASKAAQEPKASPEPKTSPEPKMSRAAEPAKAKDKLCTDCDN